MNNKELTEPQSFNTSHCTKTFHLRFQELLKNTTFIGFSRQSGISDKSIRDYFYGKTVPNIQKVKEMADLLNCNPCWLAFGIGAKERTFAYPKADNPQRLFASEPNINDTLNRYTAETQSDNLCYLSDAYLKQYLFGLMEQHASLSDLADNLSELFTSNKLSIPFKKDFIQDTLKSDPKELFIYKVSTDSMAPSINSQDIIVINAEQTLCSEGIYLLLINGTLVLRHIQQLVDNKLKLSCTNPLYSPEIIETKHLNQLFFILGKVIWVGSQLN